MSTTTVTDIGHRRAALVAVAAGCALLVMRPPLLRAAGNPTALLVGLFVVLLAVGVAWPNITIPRSARDLSPVAVLAVGLAAFAAGRVLGGGHPPAPATAKLLILNSLAAVAEEAFFRRLTYATLLAGGELVAIAGSAILFAVVHVTVYGLWVLPIDLAAGLILSWQRWATGSWSTPAITHLLANVLVVI